MATIQPRGPAADPLVEKGNQAVQAVAEPQTYKFDDGSTFDITGKQIASPTIPAIPDNRNIPVAQVQPTTALTLPQPEQGPDLSVGMVEGARTGVKSVSDYIRELAVPESEASKTQSSILSKIQELIPQTGGRGQAQLDEEQKQGLPDLKTSLASINAEILSKVAEFDKVTKDIEKNSNFKGSFSAKANELRRTYAAETGLLQARALGLQGQVQAAQETANRAVDLKYSTIEDNLRIYESQLRALEPILNKEEKEIALARQLKIDDDRQRIAEEKAKAKENISLALENGLTTKFINKNGEFFRTADGKSYDSIEEFFKDAGVKSFQEAYQHGLVGDFDANQIYARDSERSAVGELIARYPDAGITVQDTLQKAQAKLNQSRIYKEQIRPPSTGGGGGTVTERLLTQQQDIITRAMNDLDVERGQSGDGYSNPNTYRRLKSQYISAGGNVNDFFQAVPPEVYVSPPNRTGDLNIYKSTAAEEELDPTTRAFLGL